MNYRKKLQKNSLLTIEIYLKMEIQKELWYNN